MNASRYLPTLAALAATLAQAQPAAAVDDELALAAVAVGAQRPVPGAPFCADVVTESPGQRSSGRLCRDGQGRLRHDVDLQGRRLSYLRDNVSGQDWLLDPQRRSAWRLPVQQPLADEGPPSAWGERGERMRSWAAELLRGLRIPAPPAIPAVPAIPGRSSQPVVPEVPAIPGVPPVPSAPAARPPLPPEPHGVPVVTLLPSRQVDGLRARGERSTWALPGGAQVVREVWTLPELQLTWSVHETDPRSGERMQRLQHLQRGEPDAALMRVPAELDTGTAVPR